MTDIDSALSFLVPAAATADTPGIELVELCLPMPGVPFKDCACPGLPGPEGPLLLVGDSRPCPLAMDEEEALGWGRWMLGHHLSFCAWRLLSDCLSRVLAGQASGRTLDPGVSQSHVAELFDTYSALLLYAGSFTAAVYDAVVRARMALAHPAFSGLWARDYEVVHTLVGRLGSIASLDADLNSSIKFNRLVHMSLANRLVPQGHSLRREAGYAHNQITEDERATLDTFFSTRRAETCRHAFSDQLQRRNALALADLAGRPIMVSYGRESVDRFQGRIGAVLERFAVIAHDVVLATPARRP